MGAALGLALLVVGGGRCSHRLTREAHVAKLVLDEGPLKLHRCHKGPVFAALVNTTLHLHGLVEKLGPVAKEPKGSLLLVEIGIHSTAFIADRSLLAGS